MKKNRDVRITQRYVSLPGYLGIALVLAVLMALPPILYGGSDLLFRADTAPYIKWYLLYCLVVAGLFVTLTNVQKYFRFDRPIHQLSDAARKVAEGDFSVYLPLPHGPDQRNYIDTLFQDFNTMVEELGSIETLKNDFAANVSHELKTPLAAIQNNAQLLERTDLDPVQREYTGAILDSTHRLGSLIYNILKLNKLESQRIQPKPQPYDLCRQLVDCALGFESVWEEKSIDFDADLEDRADIVGDEELLALVWNNLLSNAFKFTPAGGSVTLRQYTEGEEVVVEVADTGCGMSPQVMKHIFDKFYQGDTSHAVEGNGLGLALTLRVLQMTGGTIAVDSAEGEGSTFTVRLPARPLEEEEDDQ